jgi:predicted ABC-type ATPase
VPLLTVFGGPNGSGKSSVIRQMEFEGQENLLDTDAIAKRMDPDNPRRAAVAAGREVILRTREYLGNRQSFAIETTLSSRSTLTTICEAMERGFIVHLFYVCVSTPERSIQRVCERVTQGGHDVPEEDIRRRYARSLQNLPAVLL